MTAPLVPAVLEAEHLEDGEWYGHGVFDNEPYLYEPANVWESPPIDHRWSEEHWYVRGDCVYVEKNGRVFSFNAATKTWHVD